MKRWRWLAENIPAKVGFVTERRGAPDLLQGIAFA